MAQKKEPLGFFAMWKATDAWFQEEPARKEEFMKRLQVIFEDAKAKGVKMYGVYDCCWSSEWRYFTFWECPSLDVLEETMARLAEMGDIYQYNIHHLFIGRRLPDEYVQ